MPPPEIQPKRKPKQARSQDMVRRILDATTAILTRDGVEGLTTNHVADEAGISVASIYQFFPNKQAIIYAVYLRWVESVADRIRVVSEQLMGKVPWRAFAEQIAQAASHVEMSSETEFELLRAMWSSRELLDLDRQRNRAAAERAADAMQAYGSKLPRDRLVTLGGFASELFTLAAERSLDKSPMERADIRYFAVQGYVYFWSQAMDGVDEA